MDNELAMKLLKLYLYQCKYKHSFVFLQFRKLLPSANKKELMGIFDHRKRTLMEIMRAILELITKETLEGVPLCSEDEFEEPRPSTEELRLA